MEKVSWDTPTMAELYLEQGHKEKAVQIYRAVVDEFPNHDQARRRLQELTGNLPGEQTMVFEEQARQFVQKVPGVIACSVMGFDGVPIATHTMGGLTIDVDALFTEWDKDGSGSLDFTELRKVRAPDGVWRDRSTSSVPTWAVWPPTS